MSACSDVNETKQHDIRRPVSVLTWCTESW